MKKIAVIVQSKDADEAVKKLRTLGVVHVENQRPPKGDDVNSLQNDMVLATETISILSQEAAKKLTTRGEVPKAGDWRYNARHIVDLSNRLEQLEAYSMNLKSRIAEWEAWGDFNPDKIAALKEKGIYVRLYKIPTRELDKIPSQAVINIISTVQGIANCALTTRQEIDVPFKEIALPKTGLGDMRARMSEDAKTIVSIKETIARYASYQKILLGVKRDLERDLEFCEALRGMGHIGEIMYLTGYVPSEAESAMLWAARKERWGISIKDPSEEDYVPTYIRNPKWVSIIEPVFKLIEIAPGYRELDISPLFLLFLSLFFGMIIGDAGYGLLYIALIAFAQKKLKATKLKDSKIFYLLYLFSASAVLWGVITGTVFGQEWYLKAGLKPLIPVLNDTKFLQAFCFFLGAFHLTLGHAWQAARKFPSLPALADAGWIAVLWAAFFLARTLILGYALPIFTKWLIILGIALVIFCTSPHKNIFKMIGQGLGTVALSIMNNFTDVVSYVRLFAVGLAGIAISDTVNALASTFGEKSIVIRLFILFVGHTINLVLGPISVLVHGVRLNVLEFSSHVGLTWSGRAYKPLKG